MLSFELSIIDLVLIVAVIVLLSLHMTRTRDHSSVELRSNAEEQKSPEEEMQSERARVDGNSGKCSHRFGFLRTIPRGVDAVPEECYSCPRMMECLFSIGKRG